MAYQSKHTGADIDAGIDAAISALPKSGGAMTGPLILYDDPTSNKSAATKQYVDNAVENIALTPGDDGKSAYEIALDEGFEGTETEWLDSLKGNDGERGERGERGSDGISPIVAIDTISGGHRVTITDANGPHVFDVMDGADGSGGDGSGDMIKAVYDSNNSGIVDDSEMLGGKTPNQYASADHTHSEYADAEHTHEEYASVNHAHEEYADAEHAHDVFSVGEAGFVPAPTANDSGKFLRGDGTWSVVEGGSSFGGCTRTLLWENSKPNEAVPNSKVIVNLASDDYDELEIFYKSGATSSTILSQKVLKGFGTQLMSFQYPSTGPQITYRTFTRVSDTQYEYEGSSSGFYKDKNVFDNGWNVPHSVYGIKY